MLAEQTELKLRECAAVDCSTVFALARHPNGGWTRKRFCGAVCQRRHRDRRLHGHVPSRQRKDETARRRAAEAQNKAVERDERRRVRELRFMLRQVERLADRTQRQCSCAACKRARDREASRNWRRENREAKRADTRRYRALNRGAPGRSTSTQDAARFAYYGGLCAYCDVELASEWHWDHVIPLSRGGTNWPANLRPACVECNTSKRDSLLREWRGKGRLRF